MRNKIKQLMNKEEGFTLVELLAVIVILGIILAIAIPSIGGVINRAETDANDASAELIEDSARLYYTQRSDDPDVEEPVLVATLISEGYLDLRESDEVPSGSVARTEIDDSGVYKFVYTGDIGDDSYPKN